MRFLLYSNYYVSYSYGIQIEYELIHTLRNMGYEAYNLVYDQILCSMEIPEKYKDQIIINIDLSFVINDDDICIYTDFITDNPLKARSVVRYLLNKPYTLTGKGINYGPYDYLLAYSGLVSDTLPRCFIIKNEIDLFERLRFGNRDLSKVVLYFGKVDESKIIENYRRIRSIIKNYKIVEIITRKEPDSRTETLKLLSDSSLLISFDPLTNLNYEATLLGVPVYLVQDCFGIISNQYFKYYGITDDINKIELMSEDVDKAWDQYVNWVSYQDLMVKEVFSNIVQHFDLISKNDTVYQRSVKNMNDKQKQIDYEYFSLNNSVQYLSILLPDNLPRLLRKELHVSTGRLFNRYDIKEKVKTILRKMHLLESVRIVKEKYIRYKSLKMARKR